MAGEQLGVSPVEIADPGDESDSRLQAAVVCPIPGMPADRCCRRFPCVRIGAGPNHPLPGLDMA
jgi:hypothetical protein